MNDRKQERPLGTAREAVLGLMAAHGGVWHAKSSWRWENNTHWTEELCRSLASRGLVNEKEGFYTLTKAGEKRAADLYNPTITGTNGVWV